MSRRYDSRTTIFSPEGRLYQVEYAMEAIGNAGTAIGILSKDGVVLVGQKKVTSKLLQTSTSTEKMYKIDDHVACAVAGIMSDANILINTARVQAQCYTFSYQEPMPVEQLVQSLFTLLSIVKQYAHWFYEDNSVENNPSLKSFTLKEFTSLMFNSCDVLRPYVAHIEDFTSYKVRVPDSACQASGIKE